MKHLTCAAVAPQGTQGCPNFAVSGETDDEVIGKMKAHAGEVHADKMKDATPESMQEWEAMARTKITEE